MRGARCAEGAWRAPGVPGGRRSVVLAVVGPWQYQCGDPVGGEGSTRYTHPPVPSLPHPAGYLPRTMYPPLACTGAPWTCTYDRFRDTQGDPRGVIRTGTVGARTGLCRSCRHLTPSALRPAPWRLVGAILSYISVYLSYISDLGYLKFRISQI